MRKPTGQIDQAYPHYVCKLRQSIYGLRQAFSTMSLNHFFCHMVLRTLQVIPHFLFTPKVHLVST